MIYTCCIQALATLDIVRDYIRFVITFFEVINMSAPHLYHSALPLSPQTSIIHEMYKQHTNPFMRVVWGMPLSWEPITATAYINDNPRKFAWSPCNRFIAFVTSKGGSVKVLDAVTLSSLGTFEYSGNIRGLPLFSPDSRRLTGISHRGITSWDLQTGAPRGVIKGSSEIPDFFSFAYSNDGKAIVLASERLCIGPGMFNHRYETSFSTYDLHSWTYAGAHRAMEGKIIHQIWTHDEHFRFLTVDRDSIRIWQSPFTLEHPPVEVESLPVPEEIGDADGFLFLPALSRLAFTLGDLIHIWDAKASKLLLKPEFKLAQCTDKATPIGHSFSPDGRFFASANSAGKVHVWKESLASYVLHQQLLFPTLLSGPQISPNGESIIISLPSMLRRWRTRDQVLSLPSISTGNIYRHPFSLGFSPNKKFAVFARQKGNMARIVDVRIYVSQLFGPVTVFSNIFAHAFAFLIFPDRSLSSSSVVLLR